MIDLWREDFCFDIVHKECGTESFLALLKNGWVVMLSCPAGVRVHGSGKSRFQWYRCQSAGITVPIHETHNQQEYDNLQTVVAWQPILIPQKFKWWENDEDAL